MKQCFHEKIHFAMLTRSETKQISCVGYFGFYTKTFQRSEVLLVQLVHNSMNKTMNCHIWNKYQHCPFTRHHSKHLSLSAPPSFGGRRITITSNLSVKGFRAQMMKADYLSPPTSCIQPHRKEFASCTFRQSGQGN